MGRETVSTPIRYPKHVWFAFLYSFVPPIMATLGIAILWTMPPIFSLRTIAVVLCFATPWALAYRFPRTLTSCAIAIVIYSTLISLPINHSGVFPATFLTVVFTSLNLSLYYQRDAHLLGDYVVIFLMPIAYIEAAALIVEGLTVHNVRATGFFDNPNPAAGFMAIAAVVVIDYTRRPWAALPFIVALPFTGSRWETVCLAALLLTLAIAGRLSWRGLLAIGAVAIAAVLFFHHEIATGYRATGDVSHRYLADLAVRFHIKRPGIIPGGFLDNGDFVAPHNVYLRLMYESGVIAGVAWLLVTIAYLVKWPRLTAAWFVLFALFLFSIMESYPLILNGGLWVLMIAWREYEVEVFRPYKKGTKENAPISRGVFPNG